MTGDACESVDLLVDGSGGQHIVVECNGLIHYATSHGSTGWSTVVFSRANGVVDRNPQLAIDGDRLYAAYSQAVAQGGCGGEFFTEVGVYVRSRLLPNGAWSAATRIGPSGDQLDAFAAHAGTLVLAVTGLDGASYLETASGGTLQRYKYAGFQASVGVAPNGQVGLAYVTSSGGLHYATLSGGTLTSATVPGIPADVGTASGPQLAFDTSGNAHLAFTFGSGAGCALRESSLYGTYYAVDAGGSWTDRRVSTLIGTASLALDPSSGRTDVLVDGSTPTSMWGSVSLYSSIDGRTWARTILESQSVLDTALSLDPVTDKPVVAVVEGVDDTQTNEVLLLTEH